MTPGLDFKEETMTMPREEYRFRLILLIILVVGAWLGAH
jgi:hypothetical protein